MEEYSGIIDNKYLIKYKLGEGGFSKVYLVIDMNNKCEYAAKIVFKDYSFNNEKKIYEKIKKLKNINLTNITQLIYSNKNGTNQNNGGIIKPIKYFIFEYQQKRDLLQYALFGTKCKERKCIKFIFKKILEAVQAIHEIGIFHLDINLKNILVNELNEPKLSDFGLSEQSENCYNGKLKDGRGTPGYISPQMKEGIEFDGIKSDIYSLGISLFVLVVGNLPFKNSYLQKEFYKNIKNNKKTKIKTFWDNIRKKNDNIDLSEKFQNLFSRMISYDENDRPSIKSILLDKWFDEVKDLNFNDIEVELRILFNQKEYFIKDNLQRETPRSDIGEYESKESLNKEKYFEDGIKIKKERPGINMDYYIKIKEKIDIINFMNKLANHYTSGLCDSIKESNKNLQFNAIFEKKEEKEKNNDKNDEENNNKNEENDKNEDSNNEEENEENEEEDDDEEEDIISVQKNLLIQAKIFEGLYGGYILRFKKKEGELFDFYKIIKKIMDIAQQLINELKDE